MAKQSNQPRDGARMPAGGAPRRDQAHTARPIGINVDAGSPTRWGAPGWIGAEGETRI